MLFILIEEVSMVSFEQKKIYLGFIFTIMLLGVFSFGFVSSVSKVSSSGKLSGSVFSKSVATVVDSFCNSNMNTGKNVVITQRSIEELKEGDYVIFNDFIGAVVRADNCGRLVKIENNGDKAYLFIASEINQEVLRLPASLYLGRVEYYSQLNCGWFRFIASSWSSLIFILAPIVFGWILLFRLRFIVGCKASHVGKV